MTLEEAKEFFVSMGCSSFHMCRENPNLYEEFRNLQINFDILETWKQEQLIKYFKLLEHPNDDSWNIHSRIIDLLNNTTSKKNENAEKLIKVMERLVGAISKKSAILIAENMAGRTSDFHDGGFCFLSGQNLLIKQGYIYCSKMLDFDCTEYDNDISEDSGWKNIKSRKENAENNMKKAVKKFRL